MKNIKLALLLSVIAITSTGLMNARAVTPDVPEEQELPVVVQYPGQTAFNDAKNRIETMLDWKLAEVLVPASILATWKAQDQQINAAQDTLNDFKKDNPKMDVTSIQTFIAKKRTDLNNEKARLVEFNKANPQEADPAVITFYQWLKTGEYKPVPPPREQQETPPPVPPRDEINPELVTTQYLEFLTTKELKDKRSRKGLKNERSRIQKEMFALKPVASTRLVGDTAQKYLDLQRRERHINTILTILTKRSRLTISQQQAQKAQNKNKLLGLRRKVVVRIGRFEHLPKPLTQKQDADLNAKQNELQNELALIDALLKRMK